MEESSERYGQEQTNKSENAIVTIGNEPVMQSAIDILSILGSKNQVILKAKGNSIPNAVASLPRYRLVVSSSRLFSSTSVFSSR